MCTRSSASGLPLCRMWKYPMSRSRTHGDRRDRRPKHRRDDPCSSFRCSQCRQMVSASVLGSRHRNHCPCCLWSLHVDKTSGDRASDCGGRMEPISVWVQPNGEWALVHRCVSCRGLRCNRIAGDDNEFVLMSLASRPMALPPFPLEPLARSRTDNNER